VQALLQDTIRHSFPIHAGDVDAICVLSLSYTRTLSLRHVCTITTGFKIHGLLQAGITDLCLIHACTTQVGLLFCRWDVMGLERLVGTARTKKMISGESSTFMFC